MYLEVIVLIVTGIILCIVVRGFQRSIESKKNEPVKFHPLYSSPYRNKKSIFALTEEKLRQMQILRHAIKQQTKLFKADRSVPLLPQN